MGEKRFVNQPAYAFRVTVHISPSLEREIMGFSGLARGGSESLLCLQELLYFSSIELRKDLYFSVN